MKDLLKTYADTAPAVFWMNIRHRGSLTWERLGSPAGRRAEFEARMERKLRARLARGIPAGTLVGLV